MDHDFELDKKYHFTAYFEYIGFIFGFSIRSLTGQHIGKATKYFLQKGLNLGLLVSDKRTFFPLVPLGFRQGMPMTGAGTSEL